MLFANVFQDLGDEIKGLMVSWAFIAWQIAVAIGTWLWQQGAWVFGQMRTWGDFMIMTLLQRTGQVFPTVNTSGIQTTVDQINYVFPLSEMLVMTASLFSLYVIIFGYRFVKSWIPTESS